MAISRHRPDRRIFPAPARPAARATALRKPNCKRKETASLWHPVSPGLRGPQRHHTARRRCHRGKPFHVCDRGWFRRPHPLRICAPAVQSGSCTQRNSPVGSIMSSIRRIIVIGCASRARKNAEGYALGNRACRGGVMASPSPGLSAATFLADRRRATRRRADVVQLALGLIAGRILVGTSS
jgi:hypothetical protein